MTDEEFTAVFDAHKNAVYQFAWRMSNSTAVADDVCQDVFLVILRGQAKLDQSRGSIRSLLIGIARHFLWRRWKQDRRSRPLEDDSFVAQPLDLEMLETQHAVCAAVAALPHLQRETLILFVSEYLSLREIAFALNTDVGAVKARLHRARENLGLMLAPHYQTKGRNEKHCGTPE